MRTPAKSQNETPAEMLNSSAPGGVEGMVPPSEVAPSLPLDPDPETPKPPRNKGGRPRKTPAAAPKAPAAPAGGRPSNRDRLARQLSDQYTTLGVFLMLVAPNAGQATIAQADSCGSSLAAWAETNPKVKRALERTLSGAGFATVLAAHLPIVLAVVTDVQARNAGPAAIADMPDLASMFGG